MKLKEFIEEEKEILDTFAEYCEQHPETYKYVTEGAVFRSEFEQWRALYWD